MKIQEIYKEKFVGEMMKVNPKFYLFNKEVEHWEAYDWQLWSKMVDVFLKLLR